LSCTNLKSVNQYSTNSLSATKKFEEIPYTFSQHCRDRCRIAAIDSFKIYREIKCPCDQYKRADSVTQLVYRALRGYFDGLTRLSKNQLTNYQIDRLKKAVQDDAADSQAQFNAGRILVHRQNYREGIQHLLKSLSTTDRENKPSYLYAVGAAYVRAGDRENGLRYLNLARQEAAALEQSKLVESIDDDLRTLGVQQTPH